MGRSATQWTGPTAQPERVDDAVLACVIVNPSKPAVTAEFRSHLARAIRAAGYRGPIWLDTTVAETGATQARLAVASGARLVIAVGGDGTVRAVAAGLAGTDAELGVIPLGTANLAARNLGLEVIAGGVADNPDAVTRFVKITRPGRVSEPTGADKTTLMVQLPHDRAGALLGMLEQFSARGVNLSRIESRPAGDSLGRYRFSIDVEGHIREERVQAAFIGLHRTCPQVRFLGSYPRLDARPTTVLAGTSDKDFVVARAWVADVLEGRTL